MSGAAFGFAILVVVAAGIVYFIGTRRILQSPYPSAPVSAVFSGWRALAALAKVSQGLALVIVAAKVIQISGYSARSLALASRSGNWLAADIAIDVGFTLAWAAIAVRIGMFILAPDIEDAARRARTWRAVRYGLSFWGAAEAVKIVGVVLVLGMRPNWRFVVLTIGTYAPFLFIVASALTRPAIAIGLPRPFRECLRILRENWLGIAVTLGLGALPLGLVYLAVGLIRQAFHPSVVPALLMELPIAVVSAVCYAAFEAVIATMYRRIN